MTDGNVNEGTGVRTAEAQPGWTAPSSIPQDVAKKILAARMALVKGDVNEAHYHLYSIADPTFESYKPWQELEKQSNVRVSDSRHHE